MAPGWQAQLLPPALSASPAACPCGFHPCSMCCCQRVYVIIASTCGNGVPAQLLGKEGRCVPAAAEKTACGQPVVGTGVSPTRGASIAAAPDLSRALPGCLLPHLPSNPVSSSGHGHAAILLHKG